MKNIFESLDVIKIRPEFYLGEKKITYLYHFINGYLFKSLELGDEISSKIRDLHFWLPAKTGIDIENWRENLLIKSDNNEEKALDLFFQYLKVFKEEMKY
jgi:hypothetical protein